MLSSLIRRRIKCAFSFYIGEAANTYIGEAANTYIGEAANTEEPTDFQVNTFFTSF